MKSKNFILFLESRIAKNPRSPIQEFLKLINPRNSRNLLIQRNLQNEQNKNQSWHQCVRMATSYSEPEGVFLNTIQGRSINVKSFPQFNSPQLRVQLLDVATFLQESALHCSFSIRCIFFLASIASFRRIKKCTLCLAKFQRNIAKS